MFSGDNTGHFLLAGLFGGLAGGSFAVGTPYVARWFEKELPVSEC